jgi:hypothetical protein
MRKLSLIFTILAIVIALVLAAFNRWPGLTPTSSASPSPIVKIEYTTPTPNVTYSFMADTVGQTALDVLKNKATIEYETYQSGVVVTTINGLSIDDGHRWSTYLNGERTPQSIDTILLRTTDEVTFIYEELVSQ